MESQTRRPFRRLRARRRHVKLRGVASLIRALLRNTSVELRGRRRAVHGRSSADERSRENFAVDDQVDVHFHAEEASDCFPDLVSHAPRVSDRVAILLAEHGELRAEIHQIVAGRGAVSGDARGLASAGDGDSSEFTAKLLNHEQTGERIGPGSVHGRHWFERLISRGRGR